MHQTFLPGASEMSASDNSKKLRIRFWIYWRMARSDTKSYSRVFLSYLWYGSPT
jgi:hypothetical protein